MTAGRRRFGRLPGDPSREEMIARMIRVDHAGEYGAKRIYDGQLAVLGKRADSETIRAMAKTEEEHLAEFNKMLVGRRVRPTLLHPIWHVAGFALGAGTALLGRNAAMACTAAVEEVIEKHYADQAAMLDDEDPELKRRIEKFRDEEIEHRDTALAEGASRAPGYPVLTAAVKTGTRIAIWLSERI